MERLPRSSQLYVLTVLAAASSVLWVRAATISWDRWPEMLMFTALITLAAMFPIPNPLGGYLTSTPTLLYVLVCVHNPETSLLVAGAASGLGAVISRGWVPWQRFVNGAQWGLSAGIASLVFHLSGGSLQNPGLFNLLVPLALASLAMQLANGFFVEWYFSGVRKTAFGRSWIIRVKDLLMTNFLTVPTGALLAVLFVSVHPLTLLLFLISLPAQRWAIQLFLQQQRIFGQAINSLVLAMDASFPEGRGHSRRVADLAVATARQLGLSDSVIEGIELGALVHDVGMIGLEEFLDSNSRSDEGNQLEHVKAGAQVATEMPRRDVRDIVLYHHEHFDGRGYLGVKASQIPIGARVVALAEAVESMINGRGPRSDGSLDDAIVKKVREESGKQFDPRVVDAFVAVARVDPKLLRSRSEILPPSLDASPEPGSQ